LAQADAETGGPLRRGGRQRSAASRSARGGATPTAKITDLVRSVIDEKPIARIATEEDISDQGEVEQYKLQLGPHILHFREASIGIDPRDVERIVTRIRERGASEPRGSAVRVVETPLRDLAGEARGDPVPRLLGGARPPIACASTSAPAVVR
jgi:L-alanine-DL-glutamate epimerase-like enolase superfamily enzyme